MKVDAGSVLERFEVAQEIERDIDSIGGAKRCGSSEHHSAREFIFIRGSKVESGALTGASLVHGFVVHLYPTDAQPLARGEDLDLFFFPYPARDQSPGDDGAEALHGEDAIDGQ